MSHFTINPKARLLIFGGFAAFLALRMAAGQAPPVPAFLWKTSIKVVMDWEGAEPGSVDVEWIMKGVEKANEALRFTRSPVFLDLCEVVQLESHQSWNQSWTHCNVLRRSLEASAEAKPWLYAWRDGFVNIYWAECDRQYSGFSSFPYPGGHQIFNFQGDIVIMNALRAGESSTVPTLVHEIGQRAIADSARKAGAKKRGEGEALRFGDFKTDVTFTSIFSGKGPTPSQILSSKERDRVIEDALLQLPCHHREIINLRFFCEMSFSEICQDLGIGGESTARKALHRAVTKLREIMVSGGYPVE